MSSSSLRLGLSPEHACSYLPEQREQLLVLLDDRRLTMSGYETLLAAGFRRSGDSLYRPHCPACHACQPIRLPVQPFSPSRSQRRILQRNQDLSLHVGHRDEPDYYPLFADYIKQRHADGSMYPPSPAQYRDFLLCRWMTPHFVELRQDGELLALAITDVLPDSLSAVYTCYAPAAEQRSLGTLAVLQQIELARRLGKKWLYLGYQVDGCRKMNYKRRYHPHQRWTGLEWKKYDRPEE